MRLGLSAALVGMLVMACSGRYVGARDGQGGSAGSLTTVGGSAAAVAGMAPRQHAGESAANSNGGDRGSTGLGGEVTTSVGGGVDDAAGANVGGAADSTGPSVCDGKTINLDAYVNNFETSLGFGAWYAFSDTMPPNMPLPERTMLGALRTMYAGHVYATGIKSSKLMGYGAGFGVGLVDPALGNCGDVSAFKGISFWIKGVAGTDNTLKFQIVSALTQPVDSFPRGDCPSGASCAYKHPAKTITLTPDWRQVVIDFTELTPASSFSPGKVLGFNLITDGPDYDVMIDEVSFFQDTAPPGPVAI